MSMMNQAMTDLLQYNSAILPRKRSVFNKSHSHTTTFDSGYIIPFMWDRVLPGDEKKIKYSGLCRMATPIHPTMDDARLDVWAFYLPDRLWWTHAREFYGENKDAAFNSDGEYEMPYLRPDQYAVQTDRADEFSYGVGSLNDYFGFPCMSEEVASARADEPSLRVTAALHRCYHIIWNEWFRNSSVQSAEMLNDGDFVTDDEWEVIRKLKLANKYPDYFTTLLREPQAGDDVLLPLGDFAPVVSRTPIHSGLAHDQEYASGLKLVNSLGGNLYVDTNNIVRAQNGTISDDSGNAVYPNNLWADLTFANRATINNLRAAITIQHLLEVDALAGKRYQSIIATHFGCFTPDATLQRPELLGATTQSLGMRQVVQTSESSDGSPLGNVAAFSLTNIANEWLCNKSFTEPGFILVLGCVRPQVSYSQGIDPLLTKLARYDHYWPVFDNLGNQPVLKKTLYAGDSADVSTLDEVLGYAEAWTEYRIKNNRVSGLMRPDVPQSLSSWNYSEFYASAPTLDSEFIAVDPSLIDRTIAVPSQPQFICDSYFDYTDIKNMSVHSVPGLTRL